MMSIIFSTNRLEPKFDWFIDSLFYQTTVEERKSIELIFIDYALCIFGEQRKEELKKLIEDKFTFKHISPKQNYYQGEGRKTTGEYFSTSNARNTGAMAASGTYLVFVDDVAVIMPSWFAAVKRAYKKNMTVCGAYQKHYQMEVEDGKITSSRMNTAGKDSRWNRGNDYNTTVIPGGSLFCCSMGIGKENFFSVDGFDELCDSIGGEDYHFGIRLNNAGYAIHYDRSMFTVESEELHVQPYLMKREDRVLPPQAYLQRLTELGVKGRKTSGNWDSSHMILDILMYTKQTKAIGAGDGVNHWFDKKPLIEML
jgi:hypothetical protein